jgi:hypothetical protein
MCNLLFSGYGDTGHYSVLVFINNMNIQNLPKEIYANTNSKHKTHYLTGRRERKKSKENQNQRVIFYICALSHNIVQVTPYNLDSLKFKCKHCH